MSALETAFRPQNYTVYGYMFLSSAAAFINLAAALYSSDAMCYNELCGV